jgi:hypothetical protein
LYFILQSPLAIQCIDADQLSNVVDRLIPALICINNKFRGVAGPATVAHRYTPSRRY